MGIRGTCRRSRDWHFIHCNNDTDIIITEEPSYGSLKKPDELYHLIEHFCLGRRRIELFGEVGGYYRDPLASNFAAWSRTTIFDQVGLR